MQCGHFIIHNNRLSLLLWAKRISSKLPCRIPICQRAGNRSGLLGGIRVVKGGPVRIGPVTLSDTQALAISSLMLPTSRHSRKTEEPPTNQEVFPFQETCLPVLCPLTCGLQNGEKLIFANMPSNLSPSVRVIRLEHDLLCPT